MAIILKRKVTPDPTTNLPMNSVSGVSRGLAQRRPFAKALHAVAMILAIMALVITPALACDNDAATNDGENDDCDSSKNNGGGGCPDSTDTSCTAGDPINVANGNKYESEIDFISAGPSPLILKRSYNSSFVGVSSFGAGWRGPYSRSITLFSPNVANITRDDGKVLTFTNTSPSTLPWSTTSDVNTALKQVSPNGWQYLTGNFETENYDANGKLTSVTDRAGLTQTMGYDALGRLATVTNPFGRSLVFNYTGAGTNVTSIKVPKGDLYRYSYDANNNLKTVTYPDDTPAILTDNPKVTYLYGTDAGESGNVSATPATGVSYVHSLTGVIDENTVRYSTDSYDNLGRDFSNQLAGGVNKVTLAFENQNPNPTLPNGFTQVTDALNVTRTSTFNMINEAFFETGVTRSCPTCTGVNLSAQTATTFDINGNISSQTDFNGNKTCYAYEISLNLETTRIEGLPGTANCTALIVPGAAITPPARRISTFWINTRLPKMVAEPNKITYYTYFPNGKVQTKTEHSTVDNTGELGFNGTWTADPPRVWTYTYDGDGQVKTANGPRTDVADITNYDYYVDTTSTHIRGDLHTVTNTLGQVTTFDSYDLNGRPTQITAPDGVVTNLAYTPRSQLKTVTVTGGATVLTTQYGYYPTDLLNTVTQADCSVLTYGYDDAHRLTSITDKLGNKITYTLDLAGNRKTEAVTDPANVIRRNITRVFDDLSRLKTVTGAQQ